MCRDGADVWVNITAAAVRDDDGRFRYSMGLIEDITDRKRMEVERDRLVMAMEQAAEMVVITDQSGAIQYVNPAFERVTGYTRTEALGANPRFLQSGMHDDAFYAALWTTIAGGGTWTGRFINKKKDGSLLPRKPPFLR